VRPVVGVVCAGISLVGAVATTLACLGVWSTYLRYHAAYHSTRDVVGLLIFPVPVLVGVSVAACVVAWWAQTARAAAVAGAVLAVVAWGVACAVLIR
jgi:hypothetical protein